MSSMQTSTRRGGPDPRSFAARKGHLPQLSISDDAHHVTEAIGYMYGDDDSPTSPPGSRNSLRSDKSSSGEYGVNTRRISIPRRPTTEFPVKNGSPPLRTYDQQARPSLNHTFSWEQSNGAGHPSLAGLREHSPVDTATAQFPLNDIAYESSPAAVAQELSNLQALRRMSMDVAAAGDPDLPQLNMAAIPSAPSADSSDDDSSRLFWVPASLHPELAPKEFKSFLNSKAEQIRRRSGELSNLASPSSSRSGSLNINDNSAGLRRKKSMLSRQINNSVGYQDGAERLERQRSRDKRGTPTDPNLEELEDLVNSSESQRTSLESRIDEETGDIILPSVPGSSLKRSTRTKYQRTESLKGRPDRSTYAQRAARRATAGGRQSPVTPSDSDAPALPTFSTDVSNLASTLTLNDSPSLASTRGAAPNFSRPDRSSSPPADDMSSAVPTTFESRLKKPENFREPRGSPSNLDQQQPKKQVPPLAVPPLSNPIPQIIESPPPDERPVRISSMRPPPTNVYTIPASAPPQRTEHSRDEVAKAPAQSRPGMPPKQSSSNSSMSSGRPPVRSQTLPPPNNPSQTLDQPSPLPGNDTNTSNLSFIPTLTVDKKQEVRKKEDKKSGWSWLLGKEETEKDKDKAKSKISKPPQSHDNTRLDVLQTSIDGAKGRESLVLDRDSLRLEEERKKESQRKSAAGGEKKEKESIFSSIFGGKKHKADKDSHKKHQDRLSPEPPHRDLRPDVDYNWTRFSILEERAIYRMAHIKLANPRRALYSQVLLSNFMYSYLAKVQQMHPQMNLPTSAKQQRKQKEQQHQPPPQQQQQQQQQSQPDEFTQYQRYQQQQAQQTTPQQPQQSQQPQQQQHVAQPTTEVSQSTYNYDHSATTNSSQQDPQVPQQYLSQQRPNSRGKKHIISSDSGHEHTNGNSGGSSHIISSTGANGRHYTTQPHQQQAVSRPDTGRGRYDNNNDDDDMW